MNAISPYQEAVSRFLAHYGIDIDQIDGRRQRDPVFNQIMFDEAAREYIKPRLRKAREKAHKPFLD